MATSDSDSHSEPPPPKLFDSEHEFSYEVTRSGGFQHINQHADHHSDKKKILIVGYHATDVKILNNALSLLGLNCCDYNTHFTKHLDTWFEIANCQKQDPHIFKHLYHDYDVISHAPALIFWEYIYKCYPESYVILLEKDQVKWLDDVIHQFNLYFYSYELVLSIIFPDFLLKFLSPRLYKIIKLMEWNYTAMCGNFKIENLNLIDTLGWTLFSWLKKSRFNPKIKLVDQYLESHSNLPVSKMILLKKYTEHNEYIKFIMHKKDEYNLNNNQSLLSSKNPLYRIGLPRVFSGLLFLNFKFLSIFIRIRTAINSKKNISTSTSTISRRTAATLSSS